MTEDQRWMSFALSEASAALEDGDVPVGAVVVHAGRIIGRGHNQRERLNDPTAHAEMIALTAAADYLRSWRLEGCTMYVTLEPCVMCAGALVQARIAELVFATEDPKAGACVSLYNVTTDERLNHSVAVRGGVMEHECAEMLRSFFRKRRR